MKKIYKIILGVLMLSPMFVSCEKDLPVFSSNDAGLKFYFEKSADTLVSYSFAYGVETEYAMMIKVNLMGMPVDYDRPIELQQIMTGENDAVPGEHYVAFDDPSLKEKYIMPKNATTVEIPVMLKRGASLKQKDANLKFTFKLNDVFSYTAKETSTRQIRIADQLVKPKGWDSYVKHFLGIYSKSKHQFLIENTSFKWDDEFVSGEWAGYVDSDQGYCFYLNGVIREKYDAYKAEHGELMDDNGNPIEFPQYN